MKKTFLILGMLGGLLPLQAQDVPAATSSSLPVVAVDSVAPKAKYDLSSLFVSMPDSIVPLLTSVNRADCVDFLASHMKAEVKNRFGKPSELKQLTEDYLLLQLTPRSTLSMKLLPVNDSVQVICVVRTVEGPVPDSHIRFYSTDWQALTTERFLEVPSADTFYLPADSLPAGADVSVRAKADMDLCRADLSPEADRLTFIYTTPQYLVKDDRQPLQALLKKAPCVYVWKEGRFVRQD